MSDNVIILGAGFSKLAGIPLLSEFAQTMWDLAARKSYLGTPLSSADCEIFEKAEKIRTRLDGYHGRANFNERNIEDVLSLLTFDVLAEEPAAKQHLADLNNAIARTIELTCTVKFAGLPENGRHVDVSGQTNPVYNSFWRGLIRLKQKKIQFPTIITFNYDLVLERSIFTSLIGSTFPEFRENFPEKYLRIKYYHNQFPDRLYSVEGATFRKAMTMEPLPGIVLNPANVDSSDSEFLIEILKLHGSVNFPTNTPTENSRNALTEALAEPNILPPIFNKLTGSSHNNIWKIALQRLRRARNIVVIGYSLPRTDIYMQYFLKSALGPNLHFDRLTVYDPILFSKDQANSDMRSRYGNCFSAQQQDKIVFNPKSTFDSKYSNLFGTAEDFIQTVHLQPEEVFF